jgi:hypothetical protein
MGRTAPKALSVVNAAAEETFEPLSGPSPMRLTNAERSCGRPEEEEIEMLKGR